MSNSLRRGASGSRWSSSSANARSLTRSLASAAARSSASTHHAERPRRLRSGPRAARESREQSAPRVGLAVAMPAAAFVVVVRVLLLLKSIRRRAAAHTVRVHRTAVALIQRPCDQDAGGANRGEIPSGFQRISAQTAPDFGCVLSTTLTTHAPARRPSSKAHFLRGRASGAQRRGRGRRGENAWNELVDMVSPSSQAPFLCRRSGRPRRHDSRRSYQPRRLRTFSAFAELGRVACCVLVD